MQDEGVEKPDSLEAQNHRGQPGKDEAPEKHLRDINKGGQKSTGWPAWLLVILMVLLLASSVANLVVVHRAYESSRNQVAALEQLTQSLRATQRSIMNLAKMLEQSSSEEEETEEDREPAGDGSI